MAHPDDVFIPLDEGKGYLDQLFLLRHHIERVMDRCFREVALKEEVSLLLFNETDAGLGDVAFASKLMSLLRQHVPELTIILASSDPEKQSRFGLDPAVIMYPFKDFASKATAQHKAPDLMLSAPGIFDHCRIREQAFDTIGITGDVPFQYLAEYGSIRQLKTDAFKSFTTALDHLIDAYLDEVAEREGADPDSVGYHGQSGKVVVVSDEGNRKVGYLSELLVQERDNNPLYLWLTQPVISARSAGIDRAEVGVFIDDDLKHYALSDAAQTSKTRLEELAKLRKRELYDLLLGDGDVTSYERDAVLYSGYAHSAFEYFISYVGAIEEGKNRRVDVVMPNARTMAQVHEEIFDEALLQRLASLGFGRIELVGNEKEEGSDRGQDHKTIMLGSGKSLRFISIYPLPHQDMRVLLQASEPATIVSGDQSFSEAVSANKLSIVIEPVYCQTWVIDSQLALAERVNPDLKRILELAMQFKFDDARFESLKSLIREPRIHTDFQRFNAIVRDEHRLNERAVDLVKRVLLTLQSPPLAEAQEALVKATWARLAPDEGVTVPGESIAALKQAIRTYSGS
jgi:hypothetical protein